MKKTKYTLKALIYLGKGYEKGLREKNRNGTVSMVIQDGRVIQLDKSEKIRLI